MYGIKAFQSSVKSIYFVVIVYDIHKTTEQNISIYNILMYSILKKVCTNVTEQDNNIINVLCKKQNKKKTKKKNPNT